MTQRRVIAFKLRPGAAFLLALLGVFLPRVARADDAVCIAAIEAEAPLQKTAHFHAALQELARCADPSCPNEVKAECSLRITRINALMPSLVLGATDEAGGDLVSVTVTLDGAPFATNLDGRSLSLDPGQHRVRFETLGREPVERAIVAREGEKDRHLNVILKSLHSQGGASPAPDIPEAAPPAFWNTQRSLALASAGVGVVGVALGVGFGLAASSDWSAAKNACNVTSCPGATRSRGESDRSSAVTAGDVSTTAFVVGAVGLASGVVLWLTAPKGESLAAHPAPTVTGLVGLRLQPLVQLHGGGLALAAGFP